jgi:hypothetical protein
MTSQQLRVRIPEELARRLKRQVPARGRSAFVQRLLDFCPFRGVIGAPTDETQCGAG